MKKFLLTAMAAMMALMLVFSAAAEAATFSYSSKQAGCTFEIPEGCLPINSDTINELINTTMFKTALDEAGLDKEQFYAIADTADMEMVFGPGLQGNLIIQSAPFEYSTELMEVLYPALDSAFTQSLQAGGYPTDNIELRGMIDLFGCRAYSVRSEFMGTVQEVYMFFDGTKQVTFTFTNFSEDDVMLILESYVKNR